MLAFFESLRKLSSPGSLADVVRCCSAEKGGSLPPSSLLALTPRRTCRRCHITVVFDIGSAPYCVVDLCFAYPLPFWQTKFSSAPVRRGLRCYYHRSGVQPSFCPRLSGSPLSDLIGITAAAATTGGIAPSLFLTACLRHFSPKLIRDGEFGESGLML